MGFAGGERLALHLSLPFAYRRGWGGRQTRDLMDFRQHYCQYAHHAITRARRQAPEIY